MKNHIRSCANAVMMVTDVHSEGSRFNATGWLLPYGERRVTGFCISSGEQTAVATSQFSESADVALVMRGCPGSDRARFSLTANFNPPKERHGLGIITATFNDGTQKFAMFPIGSEVPLPDEAMAGMVGGHFSQIGFEFLSHLVEFGRLECHDEVLDVGCGCGRIAYGLAHYLSRSGSYTGFDTMAAHIAWARDVMSRDLPNFSFVHADIVNKEYNPGGAINSTNYRFPTGDKSITLCIAISLYTHLLRDDFQHYINETARVLKLGGRSFMTAYVMTEEAKKIVADGRAAHDIRHCFDEEGMWTSRLDVPEALIGIDAELMFRWISQAGLEVECFYPGWWAHKNAPAHQDILVLQKR